MKRIALALLVAGCGSSGGVADAGPPDASVDAPAIDASDAAPEAGPTCVPGTVEYVAKYEVNPQHLVLDATNVYWSADTDGTLNGGSVFRIGKFDWYTPGGSPTNMGSPGTGQLIGDITVDAKAAYWAGRGSPTSIWITDLATNTANKLYTYLPDVQAMTSDATTLYFASPTSIMSVPKKAGGAQSTLAPDDPIFDDPIVVDSTSIYFVTKSQSGSTLQQIPLAGGTPNGLASGVLQFGLALHAGVLYWKDCLQGTTTCNVNAMPVTGGTPKVIATDDDWWSYLAVDDTNIYWIDLTDRTLSKAPIQGGSPTVIAKGGNPTSIATDDLYLYWSDAQSGAIERYCK